MPLTKKQIKIVDALQNGGHIWKAGGSYYLAEKIGTWDNGAPQYRSTLMPKKTFDALLEKGVIRQAQLHDNQWRLKS